MDFAAKTATVKAKGVDPQVLVAAVSAAAGGGKYSATVRQ